MPKSRLARDLIASAECLVRSSRGKPRQADLRRAVSTCYYALFHALCNNCANCFVGKGSDYPRQAWRRSYRALRHGFAKGACDPDSKKGILTKFPEAIQDFAFQFYNLQIKRHAADYDPFYSVKKSEVEADIVSARKVIADFENAPLSDRRAFATFVLFDDKPNL